MDNGSQKDISKQLPIIYPIVYKFFSTHPHLDTDSDLMNIALGGDDINIERYGKLKHWEELNEKLNHFTKNL